ncbi:MAG: hypothetical protein KDF54_12390 [Hydrogenophaga sp.]|nr:hypothetical protein [Hydrogenophaga sp.]
MKHSKTLALIALASAMAAGGAWANGPDVRGILGQIQNNYNRAIQNVPSVKFSNSDNRERDRLRDLQSRDMSQMQSTLNQYSGGGQQGSAGGSSGGSIGTGSVGQGSTGGAFYEFIRYRDNDPFLFCTDGQDPEKFPDRCWWPVAPFTGAFMMNPICRPPNPYGKDWTEADWDSLGQYLRVCPMAGGKSGPWNSNSGKQPNMVPHKH